MWFSDAGDDEESRVWRADSEEYSGEHTEIDSSRRPPASDWKNIRRKHKEEE